MPLTRMQIKELLDENVAHDCTFFGPDVCVRIVAIADLPSRFGDFHVVAFYNNRDGKEHAAFVRGDVMDAEGVPVRVHSECLTGDAIGSLRCDCRDQLEAALKQIGQMDKGILLYMRQEGRGIGFTNKIRAYGLQDHGYDTIEANIALGFRDDERDYAIAAHMLDSLGVKSIRLMTNNPRKIDDLTWHGVAISERVPLIIPPNPYNEFYLKTKATRSGHLIEFHGKERLLEQSDRPILEGMTAEDIAAVFGAQARRRLDNSERRSRRDAGDRYRSMPGVPLKKGRWRSHIRRDAPRCDRRRDPEPAARLVAERYRVRVVRKRRQGDSHSRHAGNSHGRAFADGEFHRGKHPQQRDRLGQPECRI